MFNTWFRKIFSRRSSLGPSEHSEDGETNDVKRRLKQLKDAESSQLVYIKRNGW